MIPRLASVADAGLTLDHSFAFDINLISAAWCKLRPFPVCAYSYDLYRVERAESISVVNHRLLSKLNRRFRTNMAIYSAVPVPHPATWNALFVRAICKYYCRLSH